jgi:hypothetical protein
MTGKETRPLFRAPNSNGTAISHTGLIDTPESILQPAQDFAITPITGSNADNVRAANGGGATFWAAPIEHTVVGIWDLLP